MKEGIGDGCLPLIREHRSAAHSDDLKILIDGGWLVGRQMAARAVEQIHSAKGTIIGAVLNRVDVNRNPYYYSHYYRKSYADYYTSETPKV